MEEEEVTVPEWRYGTQKVHVPFAFDGIASN
jgi:hypothetical protein